MALFTPMHDENYLRDSPLARILLSENNAVEIWIFKNVNLLKRVNISGTRESGYLILYLLKIYF